MSEVALDPNRWTQKTQEAFQAAVEAAQARNNPEVTPDHLLAAMLGQEDTVTLPVLEKVGVAPLSLRNRVEDALAKLPRSYGGGEPELVARRCGRCSNRADEARADRWATSTCRSSTSCWPWPTWSGSAGTTCWTP